MKSYQYKNEKINDVFDFLLDNRDELIKIINPEVKKTIKNKEIYLPFEYEDTLKEQVNNTLKTILMDSFNLNIEDYMVLLSDTKIKTALETLYYDENQYE